MKSTPVSSQSSTWLRQTDGTVGLVRGAGVLALIQVAGIGLGYVSQILFARWLGAREYGIYAYVVGWAVLLAALPTLGLPDTVLRFVPEYSVRQDWARLRGVIRRSWLISLGVGLILALCGTAFVLAFDHFRPIEYTPELIAGIWTVPLLALVNLQTGLSRGIKQVAAAFTPNMVLRPLFLVIGALLLLMSSHALTSLMVLGASIATLPLVLLVQLGLFRRDLPSNLKTAGPVYDSRVWLSVALPLLLVSTLGLTMSQTGLIAVGALSGPVSAGLYNAAFKTASLLALVLSMTNAVAAPLFATLHAQGDHAELQRLTSTVTRWSFWSSLALAVVLVVFAEPILRLFGDDFVAARLVLAILAVGQLVNTGTGPAGALLNMTGYQNATLRVTFWSALVNVLLSVGGVLYFGIAGAALAAALTIALWNIWLWRIVVKELGIQTSIFHTFGLGKRARS
jgi:O-antigen/teichoic acid export membrane protein